MIAGLRSLLLVPYLHETTRKVVDDYLVKLNAKPPTLLLSVDDVKDRLIFRDYTRRTFVAEGVDVPLADKRRVGRIKRLLAHLSK
jgi:hypothetical protein